MNEQTWLSFISFQLIPGCSLDQGSLCPINQLFCLSRQALHRPPPAPMKEHRLSPMREEPLSAPMNEEGLQNVGAGAAGGCPSGTVGSAGSNKKPRSRTKVQEVILRSLFRNEKESLHILAYCPVGFHSHSPKHSS